MLVPTNIFSTGKYFYKKNTGYDDYDEYYCYIDNGEGKRDEEKIEEETESMPPDSVVIINKSMHRRF